MIKQNLFYPIIILVLFAVIFFDRCRGEKTIPAVAKADTTTKVQYIQQPAQIIPQYQPVIIESKAPANVPVQYTQSTTDVKELTALVKDLVGVLYASNVYKETIKLKDSSGADVGDVTLNDVVSQNKIISRAPTYQLRFPVTTNTITIHEPYKPQRQLYAGVGISGNAIGLVDAAKVGLMYKDRKDAVYEASARMNFNGTVSYELGRYFKLNLRKQ